MIRGFTIRLGHSGFGEPAIECDKGFRSEGRISPSNRLEITVFEIESPGTNCKGLGFCQKIVEYQGLNIPWTTQVYEENGKLYTQVRGSGGSAGYQFRCEYLGDTLTTTCEIPEIERIELSNVVPEGSPLYILGRFEEASGQNCKILGSIAILLPGGSLSISKL